MRIDARFLLLAAALTAVALAEPLSPEIRRYAEGFRGTLVAMIGSDPSLLKESGLAGDPGLSSAHLDYRRSFLLYRVEAQRAESAKELSEAVTSTGLHYVPLCVGSRCPLLAAFTTDGTSGRPAFVSVGQPKLTARLRSAEALLAAEPELDHGRGAKVVEFPAAHANFHLAKRSDGTEVLVPNSPREAESLLAVVRDAEAVRLARTKSQRLYGFTLEHLRDVASRLRDAGRPDETGLPLGEPGASPSAKPFNSGAGAVTPAGEPGGAVIELKTPGTAREAAAKRLEKLRTTSERVYRWARTPTNPRQEVETASSEVPGFAVLLLLAAVVLSAVLAGKLRRVRPNR